MIGIVIVVILVTLYILTTYINGKTSIPKSCEEITVETCSACKTYTCPVRKKE
jgi:hypothetical protein